MTSGTAQDPASDPPSDLGSDAIERPAASEPPPDLESRVKARRTELLATLRELKNDARPWAAEARGKLKAALSELAHVLDWGVADGWASVSGPVTQKLEDWLTAATRQLAARREQP